MTVRDLKTQVDTAMSLAPAARASSADGSGVDLRGYDGAMLVANFGAYTDGTHTPVLQHSDDNVNFTAVTGGELGGAFTAVSSGAGANTTQRVGYLGGKRYVCGSITIAGASTGALSNLSVVRGIPRNAPLA